MLKKIIALAVVVMVPAVFLIGRQFIRERTNSVSASCINNLRGLDGSKQQWELDNHKSSNDVPSWEALRPYFPNTWTNGKPVCPQGGVYVL
jgi:hypothetical protein